MNLHLKHRMTVEEFLAWGEARASAASSDEAKWELFDGVPEMQEHEKWVHARLKYEIMRMIDDAIKQTGAPFIAGIDGIGVRIGPYESYQPEVVIFPAGLIADGDRFAPDPVLVVEVLSPSTRAKDLRIKLAGYGRVASIMHYIVVDPDAREVLHFKRESDVLAFPDGPSQGKIRIEPLGIDLDFDTVFGPSR